MSLFRKTGSAPPEETRPERLDLIVFSRQMAVFLRAGIPIIDGIRVVREQAISGVFRRTLDDVTTQLLKRMPLSEALARHPGVFFDLYVEMVRTAEKTGELDTMLDQLARYLETSQATAASRRRGRGRSVAPREDVAPRDERIPAGPANGPDLPDRDGVASEDGAEADVATNGSSKDGPAELVPFSAQAAYDELVAKLRGGPIHEVPPPPPASRWPWRRRKAAAPRQTAAQRKEAKLAAKAAKAEAKLAAKAAKAEAKRAKADARADAEEAKRAQRAAREEEKRARRAAGSGGRLGRFLRLPSRRRGVKPVKRDLAGGGSWMERNFSSLQKVKRIDLIIFSRQMATFIRAGIPIIDGIRVVREQTRSSLFRRTLDEVSALLESGEPLSGALAQHPRVFSELYIDMVVAAEATGELDAILDQLAKYLERSEATSRQMRQAMLYPSLVLGLACIVVFILMTLVLPSFVALFADFDAVLPLPTQILLTIGEFGGMYGLATGGIFVMVLTLLYLVRNLGPVKRLRQRIVLRLPVVGNLVKLGIETRFARTLSILHKAGVPISQSFEIAATGTGNHVYQRRLRPVREALIAGEGISAPLQGSRLFGPLLVQMVKVGEETGTLDRYLDEGANFLDEELGYRTKQMVTIIEPLMILGVAGVVGFVALSVITPMYSILQQIH
jgi:type IV pilus assembly protein PilC